MLFYFLQVDVSVRKLLRSVGDVNDALTALIIRNLKIVKVCGSDFAINRLIYFYIHKLMQTLISFIYLYFIFRMDLR